GEAAEDLRRERLRAGEAVVLLHAGERVGAQGSALFDGDAQLLFEVDVVGVHRRETELVRFGGVDRAFLRRGEHFVGLGRIGEEARLETGESVPAGEGAGAERAGVDRYV